MSTDWMAEAACTPDDTLTMFPPDGGHASTIFDRAKLICATCSVVNECLEFAIANGERHGVWGGLDPAERARLRRPRPTLLKPCGTRAAFLRHKKAGEVPCGPCADANRAWEREWTRRRVAAGTATWQKAKARRAQLAEADSHLTRCTCGAWLTDDQGCTACSTRVAS